jgi:hypothetical protein
MKVWGNYCGPNWTAGQPRPAKDIDLLPYVAPTDALDQACMAHDRACSKGGCTRKADRSLRDTALLVALTNPSLREPAIIIAAAMSVAEKTRSE